MAFVVSFGVTAELTRVTVYGGDNGGIANSGTLRLERSSVRGPTLSSGIDNDGNGTLTMVDSAVVGTSGIFNLGTLAIFGSEISENTSPAIFNVGTAALVDTTISSNSANSSGVVSGINNAFGSSTLINCTVVGDPFNSVIEAPGGSIDITNTVIAGRVFSVDGPQGGCEGANVISGGGNIESPGDTCSFNDPTDMVNVAPEDLKLGPLADYGGPTMAHALLPGSVAIDHVPTSTCLDGNGDPLTTDQRGVARPQGTGCDVGAFEWADCSGTTCDDGNDCTADYCDPLDDSWCVNDPLPNGSLCGTDWACKVGVCLPGPAWRIPEHIGPSGGGGTSVRLAVDSGGGVTAAWQGYDFDAFQYDLWANHYTPGIGWGTAELIETSDGDAHNVQLAVDANGHVTTVWHQYDTSLRHYDLWANRYTPGIGWGTAELIETSQTDGTGGVQLAVDANGHVTAVWAQGAPSRTDLWWNRYTPGTGWGAAQMLEYGASSGGTGNPRVAIDSSGNVILVWSKSVPGSRDLWSKRYTFGVGWGAAEPVEDMVGTSYQSELVADANGNATVVWVQFTGVTGTIESAWANRYTPGIGWGTPELIETSDSGHASSPELAVDASGDVTAVWTQDDGTANNLWANRYTPGSGWGEAELVDTNSSGLSPARLTVDAEGRVTAAWTRNAYLWATHYTPGIGWGTAELIDAGAWEVEGQQVAADPQGNVVAAWSRIVSNPYDGAWYVEIWSSRYE